MPRVNFNKIKFFVGFIWLPKSHNWGLEILPPNNIAVDSAGYGCQCSAIQLCRLDEKWMWKTESD